MKELFQMRMLYRRLIIMSAAMRLLAGALIAVFSVAALAEPPVVQIQPRIIVAPAHPTVQSAPVISCMPGQGMDECAKSDEQRRMLLMFFPGTISEEQTLRVIAAIGDVNFLDNAGINSPLSLAIGRGQKRIVAALLEKGADPLARDGRGNLLLNNVIETASGSGPSGAPAEVLECLRLALERAAKAKRLPAQPPLDASLSFYSNKVNSALLKLLLDYGADPAMKGKHGQPIDLAIGYNLPDTVRALLSAKGRFLQADLDARAYDALAGRKSELLEALRSGGADPARYVKANPLTVFDAVRPERGSDLLEFVLKSGADPNAIKHQNLRVTPILEANFDPDKMLLLLKYGADPNFKDFNNYPVLAHLLFAVERDLRVPPVPVPGREARSYPKIDLARLLLDHGAKVNGDLGGWGRYGALGLARREDKDVIALLIERGATFSGMDRGGPVVAAIEMERDDLALALHGRDKRVDPQDRMALPEASRRGWREVVQALLSAGADPNVADENGWTPLALAQRRKDDAMIKMLSDAGAKRAAQPPKPLIAVNTGSEFETAVASDIDDVIFLDPPRFGLWTGKREVLFGFYGDGLNQFEQVKCERSAGFQFVAKANIAGGIIAGVCASESKHIRQLVTAAKPAAAAMLGQLSQNGAFNPDQGQLARMGWVSGTTAGPNGSEIHYFPLIAIGHGVLSVSSVVLIPRNGQQAIVVQADTMGLCENYGLQTQTPLCSDTRGALTEIARRLYARFGDKS